jgi:exosortase
MKSCVANLSETTAPAGPEAARPSPDRLRLSTAGLGLGLVVFTACLFWAYWPTFADMWERWSGDPQYSHGFLVPVFALIVLWSRRDSCPRGPAAPCLWGAALLAGGLTLRFASAYFYYPSLDGMSLLPVLAGVVLVVGGLAALRWSWPAILFLAFMLPLPFQVEMALAQPLQRLATVASTYLLQTLGFPALAEGNVIVIDEVRLEVINACSGLGMLFTFFALATAAALIIDRPLLDKALVIASAIPIALAVNVVRITATGVAHLTLGADVGKALMHDFAGWLMMPMAVGLLWLELWYLSRLLVVEGPSAPVPLALGGARQPQPTRTRVQPPSPRNSVQSEASPAARG